MSAPPPAALALWTLLTLAPGALAQGPPPAPVRVAPAVMEDVAERRMVTGELRPIRMAEVATQESGIVLKMHVDSGDRVTAGDVLATLDDERLILEKRRLTAERAAAEADVTQAQAALDRWRAEVASLAAAGDRGASNARERRDADSEVSQGAARLEKAQRDIEVFEARLALLERRLRDMRVVAPFDGVVTRKLSEDGQWLAEGASVCEILQTDAFEIVLDVPQRYLAAIAANPLAGEDLVVKPDATKAPLRIDNLRVVPQVDQQARTFRLVGLVHNESGELAAGLSVIGWVPTGAGGRHIVVPTDAVMRNEMGPFLYVARPAGEGPMVASPATLNVLFEMPGRVVVEAGALADGDLVIVEGNQRLYPMAPVMPSETAAAQTPAAPGEG